MKITGYGPWTLTLGSDREHELQMLQASLYQNIQELFSKKKGLVFPNRSDEIFAIKNKISYLTLYTFSTENWRRPESEINFLFDLIRKS